MFTSTKIYKQYLSFSFKFESIDNIDKTILF